MFLIFLGGGAHSPPMGTAGLARLLVSGYRRLPAPPPRITAVQGQARGGVSVGGWVGWGGGQSVMPPPLCPAAPLQPAPPPPPHPARCWYWSGRCWRWLWQAPAGRWPTGTRGCAQGRQRSAGRRQLPGGPAAQVAHPSTHPSLHSTPRPAVGTSNPLGPGSHLPGVWTGARCTRRSRCWAASRCPLIACFELKHFGLCATGTPVTAVQALIVDVDWVRVSASKRRTRISSFLPIPMSNNTEGAILQAG